MEGGWEVVMGEFARFGLLLVPMVYGSTLRRFDASTSEAAEGGTRQ